MTFSRSVVVVVVHPEVDNEGCFVCASSFLISVYGGTVFWRSSADRRGAITAGFLVGGQFFGSFTCKGAVRACSGSVIIVPVRVEGVDVCGRVVAAWRRARVFVRFVAVLSRVLP